MGSGTEEWEEKLDGEGGMVQGLQTQNLKDKMSHENSETQPKPAPKGPNPNCGLASGSGSVRVRERMLAMTSRYFIMGDDCLLWPDINKR